MTGSPRGLRLNNVCNIRQTPRKWPGEIVPSSDPEFKEFATLEDGLRETARQLLAYIPELAAEKKTPCIATIIPRWAPAADHNDVIAYCYDVQRQMGMIGLSKRLDLRDPPTMASLIRAMAHHECGAIVDRELAPDVMGRALAAAMA